MSCWRDCLLNVLVVMMGVYPSGCGRVDGILVSFSISIGDVGVVRTTSLGSLMKRRTVPKISSVAQGASS